MTFAERHVQIQTWQGLPPAIGQRAAAAGTPAAGHGFASRRRGRLIRAIPGILLLACLAELGVALGGWFSISWVACCIAAGLLFRSLIPMPAALRAGVEWDEHFQRFGVILAAGQVAAVWNHLNLLTALGVGLEVALVLTVVYRVARAIGLSHSLTRLLAIGMSVCGITAIVAMGRSANAAEEEVSAASTVILIFGLLSFALFPWIGHRAGLSEIVFGAWAGLAINNTAECIASGALYGPVAQATAVLVKAMRAFYLAPAVAILSGLGGDSSPATSARRDWNADSLWLCLKGRLRCVPLFLWGFFLVLALVVLGAVPHFVLPVMQRSSRMLFALGFVGIGLRTSFAHLNRLPRRIWVLGLTAQVLIAGVAFLAVRILLH